MADDTIYRQAAIDAASYECNELRGVFGRIEERLKALPSVQPKIVRCKDCYYCTTEKCWGRTFYYCDAFSYHAEGDLIGVSLQVSPEHFCGWAERRE